MPTSLSLSVCVCECMRATAIPTISPLHYVIRHTNHLHKREVKVPLTERCRGFARARVMRSLPLWAIMRIGILKHSNMTRTTTTTRLHITHASHSSADELKDIHHQQHAQQYIVFSRQSFSLMFLFSLSLLLVVVAMVVVLLPTDVIVYAFTVHALSSNISMRLFPRNRCTAAIHAVSHVRRDTRYARVKSYKNRK